MVNSATTYSSTKTYVNQSRQTFKQFYRICTDLAPICTDLYRNLQIFTDLPADCPMTQLPFITTSYAESTSIKTTQRGQNTPETSLKSRRKSLLSKEVTLQMHDAGSTWQAKTVVNGRAKPILACLCYRPRRKSLVSKEVFLQISYYTSRPVTRVSCRKPLTRGEASVWIYHRNSDDTKDAEFEVKRRMMFFINLCKIQTGQNDDWMYHENIIIREGEAFPLKKSNFIHVGGRT
jgi:hypothetical protein